MRSTAIPPLAGSRSDGVVALRMRRETDVPALADASADPATQHWLGDPPLDEAARASSVRRTHEAFRAGRAAPVVIADARTDEPLGLLNLQFRTDDVATIAYSVFPAARGRGVAARAVALATGWAHDELDVGELRLEIDPGNAASMRVAEKCDFDRLDGSTEDGKVVFARRG